MGVSATGASGASGRSLARLVTVAVVLGVIGAVAYYLYGPPVTPALHGAAVSECNTMTGGSYRHYRLEWVVSVTPHWLCADSRSPGTPAVDLGWWVSPSF